MEKKIPFKYWFWINVVCAWYAIAWRGGIRQREKVVRERERERKIGINFGRWHVNKSNEVHPLDSEHSMRLRIIP